MRLCGIDSFFTQKLSWNQMNKFPHTTFVWQGLDGSRVLTHFAPADTYCSKADVKEVLFSLSNHKDLGRFDASLLLYGFGDGGGGAQDKQLEQLRRMRDVDGASPPSAANSVPSSHVHCLSVTVFLGLPKVTLASPTDFFARLRDAHGAQLAAHSTGLRAANASGGGVAAPRPGLAVWQGELYFEYHRATFTTQALIKQRNAECEQWLRRLEVRGERPWWRTAHCLTPQLHVLVDVWHVALYELRSRRSNRTIRIHNGRSMASHLIASSESLCSALICVLPISYFCLV